MHFTIGAIVYASDAEEAKGMADSVFEGLSGEGKPFDYYEIGVDSIYRANEPEGRKLISELMASTQRHFFENLQELREGLSRLTDEQAFSVLGNDIRAAASGVGAYEGPEIRLYSPHGEGVRTPEFLLDIFANAPRGRSGVMEWRPEGHRSSDNVWIVLADVHV